jgi:hypothetical protein
MTNQKSDLEKKTEQKLWLGRFMGFLGICFSIVIGIWEAWLLPIYNPLAEQGRLHEGDSDGCFYGMLIVPTYFLVPGLIFFVFILGVIGFRLRARTMAIIAWVLAFLTLIPLLPGLISFFTS